MNQVMSFEDSVKQRLKAIVADLIPEERWDEIVRATVQDFERNDLPKLIKAELAEQYKKAITAEFAKSEWQSTWSSQGGFAASEAVKQMLIEAAPVILASMIGGAMENVKQQLHYTLQNQRGF